MRDRFLEWLGRMVSERPWRVLAVAAAITMVFGTLAATLTFDGSFLRLLGQDLPEVRNFRAAVDNFGEPANGR